MSDASGYQDTQSPNTQSNVPATTDAAQPEDAKALLQQQADEFYEQWKGGAQEAAREYILRQTPLALQSAMVEKLDKDYPPVEDLKGKLWQIDEKGMHPTVLPPGTPLYVQRQVAAQISEYQGMEEAIPNAEEMLANKDDAGVMYPPVTGTPTPHPTAGAEGAGSAPPTYPPQALDAPPQQPSA